MSVLVHEFSNGVMLPVVSLGCWCLEAKDESTKSAVAMALKTGYKALDDAFCYENEAVIGPIVSKFDGKATAHTDVKECGPFKVVSEEEFRKSFEKPHGKPRDDRKIFVTSKVWVTHFTPAGVREQCEEHLKNFDRSSCDLMLLHWPGIHVGFDEPESSGGSNPLFTLENQKADQTQTRITCWRTMEQMYHEGKFRAIGVSNYMPKHLLPILEDVKARKAAGDLKAMYPMVNQIELNVFCQIPQDLDKICKDHGILITSYSTLGGVNSVAKHITHPVVTKIAAKHNVKPAAVLLRWAMQMGYTVLPRSTKDERVVDNFNLFHFNMDNEEMKELTALNSNERNLMDPNEIN
ncbi:aldo-keto reductase [Gregarina niphandrodes]|uniref:Aldo-keto reductase n=1 Tax=Gregarina niphandrodes TaxID=110365 RepID=A0A023B129_GRENI|nr:aldo-keto reductase [Gregarina niphandrodes]EZG45096.1 aldo-keto reductase [Gregarina niphandrodes]|eukprot:XP_011132559.1 aldo-keto reductase [Gregarina niphandrodes]